MIKGNLYFIKDEFFDKFPDQMLLTNKPDAEEYNMNRPCYYAFPDEEDERILWMVPVSSQIEKFEKKYNRSIEKYGQCDVLVFGYVKGNKNVFSIQNMFPVTKKYIVNEYLDVNTNKPISIATDTKSEINAKLRKILRLNKKGIQLAHANLTYMKNCLLEELNNCK